MSENAMEGKDERAHNEAEAEIVRIENERMTRRKALRKFGFTAGMAVFSMLTVDDLARVAAKKLQETEATKGIGDVLAKEFRSAGVAMANPYGGDPPPPSPYTPPPDCAQQANADEQACFDAVNAHSAAYWIWPRSYNGEITACNNTFLAAMAVCNGGGGNPYGNPYAPFDPTACQDACDQEVMRNLVGPIYDGPEGIQDLMEGCLTDNPTDPGGYAQCVKDGLVGHIPGPHVINVDTYLKCCYTFCVGNKSGTDNCTYGG